MVSAISENAVLRLIGHTDPPGELVIIRSRLQDLRKTAKRIIRSVRAAFWTLKTIAELSPRDDITLHRRDVAPALDVKLRLLTLELSGNGRDGSEWRTEDGECESEGEEGGAEHGDGVERCGVEEERKQRERHAVGKRGFDSCRFPEGSALSRRWRRAKMNTRVMLQITQRLSADHWTNVGAGEEELIRPRGVVTCAERAEGVSSREEIIAQCSGTPIYSRQIPLPVSAEHLCTLLVASNFAALHARAAGFDSSFPAAHKRHDRPSCSTSTT